MSAPDAEQGALARRAERVFESALWGARLVTLVAVVASLAASLAMFYVAAVDTALLMHHVVAYAHPELDALARGVLRAETITHVVEVVDGFLLATVLLIFALGLYELFVSPLDPARNNVNFSRVLYIRNLDDLKSRLGKVVLMILIIRFFEHALEMRYETPLDLLTLAGGIALVGAALYISHSHALPQRPEEDAQAPR